MDSKTVYNVAEELSSKPQGDRDSLRADLKSHKVSNSFISCSLQPFLLVYLDDILMDGKVKVKPNHPLKSLTGSMSVSKSLNVPNILWGKFVQVWLGHISR
jgi:hypothetical protein